MTKTIKVMFSFTAETAGKPFIYHLARDFDLIFSLLRSDIRPHRGGRTIMDLTGEEENIQKALRLADENHVGWQILTRMMEINETSCVSCGSCVAVCVHKALYLDPVTAKLSVHDELCLACGMCARACPVGAVTDLYHE